MEGKENNRLITVNEAQQMLDAMKKLGKANEAAVMWANNVIAFLDEKGLVQEFNKWYLTRNKEELENGLQKLMDQQEPDKN